jgi:hypothetical protein
MKPCQRIRQATGCGTLHCSNTEGASQFGGFDHLPRFRHQIQNSIGIGQKGRTLARQRHPFALSTEERHAKVLFKALNPRRHVGGNTRERLRGARHAALSRHDAEDMEIRQIHQKSHFENDKSIIILDNEMKVNALSIVPAGLSWLGNT